MDRCTVCIFISLLVCMYVKLLVLFVNSLYFRANIFILFIMNLINYLVVCDFLSLLIYIDVNLMQYL